MTRHPRVRPLVRRPRVTVVIPCYNYGHYLPLAVGSALEQPGVDVEAIVIDDASPDGSGEVAREMARRDSRIEAIVHERNRGHIATYNEGLAQAAGDYVVLLSADDALAPGALARATALMEAHPRVAFTYGFPEEFTTAPPPSRNSVRSWTVWSGQDWVARRCAKGTNCINCPEVVMRTAVQREIGGYDPSLPHSGDLEMWMRAALTGDVGRVNGPAQAFYRVHGASMQRTVFAGHMNDLEGRLAAFDKVLLGDGAPPGAARLHERARRALAEAAVEYARAAFHHRREEQEPVDEYLAFARRVWPPADRWRSWCAMAGRRPGSNPLRGGALARAARGAAMDLEGRMRWRRWRWSGV